MTFPRPSMHLLKGEGTDTSPYVVDDEDSEAEVLHELTHPSPRDTSDAAPSPRPDPLLLDVPKHSPDNGVMEAEEPIFTQDLSGDEGTNAMHERGRNDRAAKRQRSASLHSRESNHSLAAQDIPGPSLHEPPNPTGESRKARKRRRKQERNKELYADRFSRLVDNPNLSLEYPPGITPLMANGLNVFDIFPILSQDYTPISYPGFFPAHNHHPNGQHHHTPWMGQPQMLGHPILPQLDQANAGLPWAIQHHMPPADGNLPGVPLPLMEPASAPATVGSHTLPQKPPHTQPSAPPPEPVPVQPIGVEPDHDPNSKHGVFKIPENVLDKDKRQYIPTPACTLVLEQLPKSHRNPDFVNAWSRRVCGSNPVKVLIDQPGAKALVEFPSSEAARTAWGSPRLGMANIGLKPHLLKGKPREDLIKAYWYRVDGVSDGVGEIEEGEIEEAGEKDTVERKETKKEKKARMAKLREEKKLQRAQELARQREALTSSSANPALSSNTQIWPPSTSTSGQLSTLPQRPTHAAVLPNGPRIRPPHEASSGSVPQMTIRTEQNLASQDADDMELSSPSPTSPTSPFGGAFPSQPPALALSRSAPSFIPSNRPPPSGPRAMQASHNHIQRKQDALASHKSAIPSSSLVPPPPPSTAPPALPPPPQSVSPTEESEAALRERNLRELVLQSRLKKGKGRENGVSTSWTPSPTVPEAAPSKKEPVANLDVEMFLASAVAGPSAPSPAPSRPPPPARAGSTSASVALQMKLEEMERDLEEQKALMEQLSNAKTKAEKDRILGLLREKTRAQETAASSQPPQAIKPSAKINLDYVVPPAPPRSRSSDSPFYTMEGEGFFIDLSDDEDEDEEDDDES